MSASFRNNYSAYAGKSLAELLRWRWNATLRRLPPPPLVPTPRVEPDLGFLHANATSGADMQPTVSWIGHATVLVQLGGLSLLTDPVFSERASPVGFAGPRRSQPPGIALDALPHTDVVLISHNHYDHLDAASVDGLSKQPGGSPIFLVPLGLAEWFRARGVTNVVELDWWQCHIVGGVEVILVPAQHWSGRGLTDHMKTLWGGFAVFAVDCQLFFAGDTGYSRDFEDVRERFAAMQTPARGGGFDIALLPIGAYEPRWFMSEQHVNVHEAVKIHRDLGAKRSLGVHWGTFELTDEPLDEPPRILSEQRAANEIADEAFFVLALGETEVLSRRATSEVCKSSRRD